MLTLPLVELQECDNINMAVKYMFGNVNVNVLLMKSMKYYYIIKSGDNNYVMFAPNSQR